MDKKFREKVTVALQKLEQYGGKVSWSDDYSVICTFEYNFAKRTFISGFVAMFFLQYGWDTCLVFCFLGLNMFLNKIYSCKKLLFAVIDDACLFPLIAYCLCHLLRESDTHIPAHPG